MTGEPAKPAQVAPATPALPTITQQHLDEQNWQKGMTAGLIAAIAGAAVWAAATYFTETQIGWLAIGVGALVGFAVRKCGQGVEKRFGFLGAGLALGGVLLGNIFAVIAFAAKQLGVGFFTMLGQFDWGRAPSILGSFMGPIDFLFYAIALYEGYKLSFRQIEQK